ncbi:hypothetical protein EVAR_83274_1 [Eumeta japonica]|uniref:Uncharacterized protein n=1 Tax=Eumeta variegata TaxID=151549 RepID=A0A4C1XBM9_EUMVA|nr:hypothetical protein EVAR_83274_1 [Eumeta japonica]
MRSSKRNVYRQPFMLSRDLRVLVVGTRNMIWHYTHQTYGPEPHPTYKQRTTSSATGEEVVIEVDPERSIAAYFLTGRSEIPSPTETVLPTYLLCHRSVTAESL